MPKAMKYLQWIADADRSIPSKFTLPLFAAQVTDCAYRRIAFVCGDSSFDGGKGVGTEACRCICAFDKADPRRGARYFVTRIWKLFLFVTLNEQNVCSLLRPLGNIRVIPFPKFVELEDTVTLEGGDVESVFEYVNVIWFQFSTKEPLDHSAVLPIERRGLDGVGFYVAPVEAPGSGWIVYRQTSWAWGIQERLSMSSIHHGNFDRASPERPKHSARLWV
jgi:hypothetical protein